MPGTLVGDEDEIVEQQIVTGIAYSPDEAKITLVGVPDRPGVAGAIFPSLADAAVNVDMNVTNVSPNRTTTDPDLTAGPADLNRASPVPDPHAAPAPFHQPGAAPQVTTQHEVGDGTP